MVSRFFKTAALLTLLSSCLLPAVAVAETQEEIARDRKLRLQRRITAELPGQNQQSATGTLGINIVNGVLINSVLPGSPAEKAGLMRGDIITNVNNNAVTSMEAFRRTVANSTPGTRLNLQIYRNGTYQTLVVEVGGQSPVAAQTPQSSTIQRQPEPDLQGEGNSPDYGYTKENPVKLGSPDFTEGPSMSRVYLRRLRDANNQPFRFERIGNVGPGADRHIVDLYRLIDSNGVEHRVYIDMYHPELNPLTLKAPKGMKITPP